MHGLVQLRAMRSCAALLLLLLGALKCHRRDGGEADRIALMAALSTAVQRAGARNGELDLSSVVHGDWDRFCVFPAYSWPELVTQRLGFKWAGGAQSATLIQDRYQLLVFTKGRSVVAWTDFDKVVARFDVGEEFINRRDAVLRVMKTKEGTRIVKSGTD